MDYNAAKELEMYTDHAQSYICFFKKYTQEGGGQCTFPLRITTPRQILINLFATFLPFILNQ